MSRLTKFFSCCSDFHSKASVLPGKKKVLELHIIFKCTFIVCLSALTFFQCIDPMVHAWSLKWGIHVRKLNAEKRKKFQNRVQIARLNWMLLTPCWHQLIVQKQQQESETEVSVGKFLFMTVINEIYWLVFLSRISSL